MQHAISAGHEITLAVAKEVLKDGGNAFDAAIAAHMAMFITEPCMASAGGNGFAITCTSKGDFGFLDFFCQTPQIKSLDKVDFFPVPINFGSETETFHIGLGSAAVPGSIAMLFDLHKSLGTIPMEVLAQPAIKLAKEGVELNEFQAFDLVLLQSIFAQDESMKDCFFDQGQIKKQGDILKIPEMADFLEFISREGKDAFYKGEISKKIDEDSRDRGGFLRRSDFEKYQVNRSKPLRVKYKDSFIHLPNGPSKGGATLAVFMSMLNQNVTSILDAVKSVQNIQKNSIELKKTFDAVYPNSNYQTIPSAASNKGTSHFNILDKMGNSISLTCSIGEGSGYFIPNTGMQLNNMLGEIFLLPNGPHSWVPNQRLQSMMTPTMVSNKQGKLTALLGSGGASRIPYAIGQVLYHLFEHGLSLNDAVHAPRCHFQNSAFQLEPADHWPAKKQQVKWEKQSLYFGGVHSIKIHEDKVEAIGDARRFGVAEVFQ